MGTVSLPALFEGGLIPGVLMSVSMMVAAYFMARHLNIPREKWGGVRNVGRTFIRAIGALLMPIIILGGIYSGTFTATEAAVIACVYALIVTLFVYRDLTVRELPKIFWESAITSAVGMVVITAASMFSYVLTKEHIPERLASLLLRHRGAGAHLPAPVHRLRHQSCSPGCDHGDEPLHRRHHSAGGRVRVRGLLHCPDQCGKDLPAGHAVFAGAAGPGPGKCV